MVKLYTDLVEFVALNYDRMLLLESDIMTQHDNTEEYPRHLDAYYINKGVSLFEM